MILATRAQTLLQTHMNTCLQSDILSIAIDHFLLVYSILAYCASSKKMTIVDHLKIHY